MVRLNPMSGLMMFILHRRTSTWGVWSEAEMLINCRAERIEFWRLVGTADYDV